MRRITKVRFLHLVTDNRKSVCLRGIIVNDQRFLPVSQIAGFLHRLGQSRRVPSVRVLEGRGHRNDSRSLSLSLADI